MIVMIHLQVVGVLLVLLAASHVFFNRYFGWGAELQAVSLLTRRVFFVHTFFVALTVGLSGAITFAYARELLEPSALHRALLTSATLFWLCRLVAQFYRYDSAIWKGDRFRTLMHYLFAVLWSYVTAVYGAASLSLW